MSTDLSHLIRTWLTHSDPAWHQMHWTPAVDIYRVDNGWLLKFDLAGVRPNEIQLKVVGRSLTVSGRRGDWVVEESRPCNAYSMEITYSQFERTLELPNEIEHLQIHTEYRDGMLLVSLQQKGDAG
jgi:HSP20 family protein